MYHRRTGQDRGHYVLQFLTNMTTCLINSKRGSLGNDCYFVCVLSPNHHPANFFPNLVPTHHLSLPYHTRAANWGGWRHGGSIWSHQLHLFELLAAYNTLTQVLSTRLLHTWVHNWLLLLWMIEEGKRVCHSSRPESMDNSALLDFWMIVLTLFCCTTQELRERIAAVR